MPYHISQDQQVTSPQRISGRTEGAESTEDRCCSQSPADLSRPRSLGGCTFIKLEHQSQKMKILPISAYVIWLWLSNVIKVPWQVITVPWQVIKVPWQPRPGPGDWVKKSVTTTSPNNWVGLRLRLRARWARGTERKGKFHIDANLTPVGHKVRLHYHIRRDNRTHWSIGRHLSGE